MATLIPSLSQCLRRMQAGEKRFARQLEEKLEADYLLWYDVPIGATGRHPDFLVLHPRRGLLVLEVKDWKTDTLVSIDKSRAVILTGNGPKEAVNPFEQARGYAHDIVTLLERDATLIHSGGAHRGRLAFPWSYGVVLTHITRAQFEAAGLGQAIPAHRVLCKDELAESVTAEAFQERLWAMFPWVPDRPLSLPQVDRIRWHIFPELRIGGSQLDLFARPDTVELMPDLIRVMDLQQEQLARSLGEGHRVIHGVAGSGKTMILGYRCQYLARLLQKPILVLCYNRTLSGFLEQLLEARALTQHVSVRTFHGWCHDQLRLYHAGLPASDLPPGEHAEQLAQRVILAVDRGLIPRGQYGAVLIDEGHDFQPEWLKLVTQMVSPETSSLLVLYDDAQSIYRRKHFSFRSVGIQAQGRTTILRLNYRNTAEILEFAAGFAEELLTPEEAEEDGVPLLRPQAAGRRGPRPQVVQLPSVGKELDYVAGHLQQLHDEGYAWRDMALLHRGGSMGESAARRLQQASIPCQLVGKRAGQSPLDTRADSVKVLTFHSCKGLEFPIVAIPRLKRPTPGAGKTQDEARLLYVAMTRAIDRLVLTTSG
ncbi:3'-5' exonuclease [Pyxidicoccus sp. 3LG]